MIIRALDSNGDWQFGQGLGNYLSANNEIIQDINTRLLSFLGDCFFAIGDGIDWFTFLGGKDSLSLQLAVRAVILNTNGVQSLVSANVITNDQARTIGMTYTVTTIYSASNNTTTTVSGSALLPIPS
jgi:hypothetical protein